MSSRTRSRRPVSIGSNQSSRRWPAVSASDCRASDFMLLLVMAWSPPALKRRLCLGFNHPEATPPSIPTTPRTAPQTLPTGTPPVNLPTTTLVGNQVIFGFDLTVQPGITYHL